MKKSISTFVLFLGMTTVSFAQMTKGVINYTMEMSSDDPEMAMASSMMAGSTMKVSFAPDKSRTDVTMGMLGKMSTIVDEKSKKMIMLTDMMGTKYAIEGNTDEVKNDTDAPKYTIETTKETKTISGYKCTKAVMKTDDGTELTGWFTKDIVMSAIGQTYINDQMPGYPLEFSTTMQGMNISFVATSVEKTPEKTAFDLKIPEGYELKTVEEMNNMGDEE